MTQRNLIELGQETFPEKGEVYFRILLNNSLREFCEETHILTTTAEITTEQDKTLYDLPADLIEANVLYDGEGREVIHTAPYALGLLPESTKIWWIEHGKLFLAQTAYASEAGVRFRTRPISAGETLALHYVQQAPVFTTENLDEEAPIPGAFHLALHARVMEQMHIGEPEKQRYWHAVWRDRIRKGKMYAHRAQDGGQYNVLIHED